MKENKKITKKPNGKKKKTNKEKFLDKIIPKTTTEKVLTVSFIILFVIVVALAIKAAMVKKEYEKNNELDLIIPILEKETNNKFLVDLTDMKKDDIKEYTFMITNYKDNKVSTKDIKYEIELENNSSAVTIKLYKGKDSKNLLDSKSNLNVITDNKLSKDKKNSDTYYLIIRAIKDTKEKENISIKINGIN